MKLRDLQSKLRRLGCEWIRITGSHEIWKLPNGNRISIVVGHRNADVSGTVYVSITRALTCANLSFT